jgi:hypothetical protein
MSSRPVLHPASLSRRGGLLATACLAAVVLAAPLACDRSVPGPDWMKGAPSQARLGVSMKVGWFLENRDLQTLVARYPLADQAVDLFLKKARINPATETGRITIYASGDLGRMAKTPDGKPDPAEAAAGILLQLDSFQDPKALQVAIAEAFPAEGTMRIDGKDCPLFVILDVNQNHFRAASDNKDRIWIGDLRALQRRASDQAPGPRSPMVRAGAWIDPGAPLQGILAPGDWLDQAANQLPGDWSKEIPRGIMALAWSVAPGKQEKDGHKLELALVGTPGAITQATPWLQRLVAITNALPDAPKTAPELVQERERVALRCTLTTSQIEGVLGRLGVPGVKFKPGTAA